MTDNNEKIDFFKKHADTLCIISIIIGSMLWINGKFNDLEKDIITIKTVLIMKQIMPVELAKVETEK